MYFDRKHKKDMHSPFLLIRNCTYAQCYILGYGLFILDKINQWSFKCTAKLLKIDVLGIFIHYFKIQYRYVWLLFSKFVFFCRLHRCYFYKFKQVNYKYAHQLEIFCEKGQQSTDICCL